MTGGDREGETTGSCSPNYSYFEEKPEDLIGSANEERIEGRGCLSVRAYP